MRKDPYIPLSAAQDTWEDAVAQLLEGRAGDIPIPVDCSTVSCMRCLCAVAESVLE